MPIYEYSCHGCGSEFELLVRSNTVLECPECHSKELEKLLSVFATAPAAGPDLPLAAGPCGGCGHPNGPGACGLN
jgi:putative FmdB family regulatory protein